jgi:hypothetical protein
MSEVKLPYYNTETAPQPHGFTQRVGLCSQCGGAYSECPGDHRIPAKSGWTIRQMHQIRAKWALQLLDPEFVCSEQRRTTVRRAQQVLDERLAYHKVTEA